MWLSLVELLAWDQDAAGSNPVIPTTILKGDNYMRKSVKRYYEIDRRYDYAEAHGFKNTKRNVGFVKHRSHKRLRKQLSSEIENND